MATPPDFVSPPIGLLARLQIVESCVVDPRRAKPPTQFAPAGLTTLPIAPPTLRIESILQVPALSTVAPFSEVRPIVDNGDASFVIDGVAPTTVETVNVIDAQKTSGIDDDGIDDATWPESNVC